MIHAFADFRGIVPMPRDTVHSDIPIGRGFPYLREFVLVVFSLLHVSSIGTCRKIDVWSLTTLPFNQNPDPPFRLVRHALLLNLPAHFRPQNEHTHTHTH